MALRDDALIDFRIGSPKSSPKLANSARPHNGQRAAWDAESRGLQISREHISRLLTLAEPHEYPVAPPQINGLQIREPISDQVLPAKAFASCSALSTYGRAQERLRAATVRREFPAARYALGPSRLTLTPAVGGQSADAVPFSCGDKIRVEVA